MADGLRAGVSLLRLSEASGEGGADPREAAALAVVRVWGQRLEALPRRERLALAVEQRNALAEHALRGGDWRVALAAWDSRDRFLGLLERDPDDDRQAAQNLARLMELAAR